MPPKYYLEISVLLKRKYFKSLGLCKKRKCQMTSFSKLIDQNRVTMLVYEESLGTAGLHSRVHFFP